MGKKSSKTKVNNKPWAPLQPHILNAAQTTSNIVGGNQGNLQQLSGNIKSFLPGLGAQAFGEQPGMAAALGYTDKVLGGGFLNGNPYLDQIAARTRENVGNDVNAAFSRAGRTGGGYHVESLSEGMANAENNLRYQDYSSERDRMAQAGALVPSLAAAQYAGIPAYLQAAQTAGQLPYAGVGALGPLLGAGAGAGTSTQTQPGGWGNALLGGVASALPFLISDRRLKRNIVKVGEAKDGLGIYEFEYGFDPTRTRIRGVMADEVKELRPQAYVPNFRGEYAGVNYAALGGLE